MPAETNTYPFGLLIPTHMSMGEAILEGLHPAEDYSKGDSMGSQKMRARFLASLSAQTLKTGRQVNTRFRIDPRASIVRREINRFGNSNIGLRDRGGEAPRRCGSALRRRRTRSGRASEIAPRMERRESCQTPTASRRVTVGSEESSSSREGDPDATPKFRIPRALNAHRHPQRL